jgi:hypothetical protein
VSEEKQEEVKFDRHNVRIKKNVTNVVLSAVPHYKQLKIYAQIYGELKREGKVNNNAEWKAAIAELWNVCNSHTAQRC